VTGISRRVATAALLTALALPAAAAQQVIQGVTEIDGPIYVTTYVEVVPSTTAAAIATMKDYRDAARKESGATLVDVLQETGQLHRFVISEVWSNRAAVAAHNKAPAFAALDEKLKPIALGPLDERIHQAQAATPPKAPGANTVIVISHCDVAGGNTANLIRAFGPLNEGSRKDSGMVRFEILDEFPAHVNHFRLQEEWADMAAFEAHNRAAHTQTYRRTIQEWLGTPYDQRIYKVVQ
jgi:quinol monooxygenase YgiN